MLAFTILIFYVYSPIVARHISGAEVQIFDEGISLEIIRQELEHTLGRITHWISDTDETQKLQSGDSIIVTIQPELVLMTAGSNDRTARISSVHGEKVETFDLPGQVSTVAFSPDRDNFVIGYIYESDLPPNKTYEFKLFSDSNKRCRTFSTPVRSEDPICLSTFSADGKWVSNIIWDELEDELQVGMYSVGHEEDALLLRGKLLEFSPDNEKVAFVSHDDVVHIRKLTQPWTQSLTEIQPRTRQYYEINTISFSSDGKLLAINYYESEVLIINIDSKEVVHVIKGETAAESVLFSPNGKHLAVLDTVAADTGKQALSFHNVENWTCERVHEVDEHDQPCAAIAFDPTGQYLALAMYMDVQIIDTFSWDINYELKFRQIHMHQIADVVFGYRNEWAQAVLSVEKHV